MYQMRTNKPSQVRCTVRVSERVDLVIRIKYLIGFAKSDRICRLNSTERVSITSESRKKFGIKGSAIIVHPTNCKDNEKKFGFDNIFMLD